MKTNKQRWLFAGVLSILLTISACQPADEAQHGTYNPNGGGSNAQHLGRGAHSIYKNEGYGTRHNRDGAERSVFPFAFDRDMGMNRDFGLGNGREPGTRMGRDQIPFGYSERSARDPVTIQNAYGGTMYIDRQVLADGIAQMVCGLQGVERASVIITDGECIIGFESPENGAQIQESVRLAGESATPRWFDVYATDEIELVESVKDVSNSRRARHQHDLLHEQVQAIIQQLGGPEDQRPNRGADDMGQGQDETEQIQQPELDPGYTPNQSGVQ